MEFKIGYTPTADDAYMLYALLEGKVSADGISFSPQEATQPELNNLASRGMVDICMISAAAYPAVAKQYGLLSCGASFGLSAGPVVVTRYPDEDRGLSNMTIAIPGASTTAYAMLQMHEPNPRTRVLPLKQLLPAMESGLADAALLIHEEFVTAKQLGLHVIVDLGKWWMETYQLPMPVTLCVARQDISDETRNKITTLIRDSIKYAICHHEEALKFALRYSRGKSRAIIEKFISQYVNELSLSIDEKGKESLGLFFSECAKASIL